MKKRLPIGISDFKILIEEDYTYVDKTLLIQELVEKGIAVSLIPRMRRFGKTLNLSMLRYFFEKSDHNTAYLFESLKIWQNEKMRTLQGQYPVIFLSLKDIKCTTWQETYESFASLIADEFRRHLYLTEGKTLVEEEKNLYTAIVRCEASTSLLTKSLRYLTEWLHRYYGKRVYLLLDEYDTPAHAAYVGGYYDVLINFLRNWLSGGLKDNAFLEQGVLTGILRIAKETIFSGLNNIVTYTILSDEYQDKFGFTEAEVQALLETYELTEKFDKIKQWYNGYRIGSYSGIYNPWSVLNCLAKKGALSPYWVNTSENALMKQLITQGSYDLKADLEILLKGQTLEKTIEEGVVFTQLHTNPETIWSLLLFSGYLTMQHTASYPATLALKIPNLEVEELYKTTIVDWFKTLLHETNYRHLLKSLTSGDIATFSQIFQDFFASSVSVFDVAGNDPEKVYHAFVLGMLVGLKESHEVKSNRESGYGRYDVMLIPKNPNELGLVLEFKKVGPYEQTSLDSASSAALKQIEDKNYAQELYDRGIKDVLLLAIAFQGKKVAFLSKKL